MGDTVSLRVSTPLGPSDLVGTLVAAAPDRLRVRRRDGTVADVAVTDVVTGRVVPPGPARRIPVADLQRVGALGWRPLELDRLGDWWLRASGGFTRRGNSAMVTGNPGLPAGAALDRVADWYAARGLRPRVQVTAAALAEDVAAVLDERGWEPEAPTEVMTAEIGPVLRGVPAAQPEVRLEAEPDGGWLAAYRADPGAPLPPVARDLLVNHDAVGFASIREDERCVAVARVTVDGRWAGLSCVEVAPDRRGDGLAAQVSAAALRWAVARGARHATLQVMVGNTAARALYDRLGFAVHHEYVYRSGPQP